MKISEKQILFLISIIQIVLQRRLLSHDEIEKEIEKIIQEIHDQQSEELREIK